MLPKASEKMENTSSCCITLLSIRYCRAFTTVLREKNSSKLHGREQRKNDSADTRSIIEKMAALNLKKAQLLGKKSFAEWKLQDQMAKTPEAAQKILADLGRQP